MGFPNEGEINCSSGNCYLWVGFRQICLGTASVECKLLGALLDHLRVGRPALAVDGVRGQSPARATLLQPVPQV